MRGKVRSSAIYRQLTNFFILTSFKHTMITKKAILAVGFCCSFYLLLPKRVD